LKFKIGRVFGIHIWKGSRNLGVDICFGIIVIWMVWQMNYPLYPEIGYSFRIGIAKDPKIYDKIWRYKYGK